MTGIYGSLFMFLEEITVYLSQCFLGILYFEMIFYKFEYIQLAFSLVHKNVHLIFRECDEL